MVVKKKVKAKVAVKKKVNASAAAKKKTIKRKVAVSAVAKKKVMKKVTLHQTPKKKPAKKLVARSVAKPVAVVNTPVAPVRPAPRPVTTPKPTAVKPALVVKRVFNPLNARRPISRSQRANQFNYMKAPGFEHAFEVGDSVEVFCDHEKSRERIRGWVKGIVVQVDHKMVAVQFRSNVYLTDGWMVPDRILWYPLTSEHIRPVPGKKPAKAKKDFIPDY